LLSFLNLSYHGKSLSEADCSYFRLTGTHAA
jgi:hypothetical protein